MSDLSLVNSASTALANTPIAAPGPAKDVASAKKAAQDFEAVFLNEFLGSMFQGIKTDGPLGGGPACGELGRTGGGNNVRRGIGLKSVVLRVPAPQRHNGHKQQHGLRDFSAHRSSPRRGVCNHGNLIMPGGS